MALKNSSAIHAFSNERPKRNNNIETMVGFGL